MVEVTFAEILNNAFLAIAAIGNAIAKWCELMMTDAGQNMLKENTETQKQIRLGYQTFVTDVKSGFDKLLADTKQIFAPSNLNK